MPTNNGYFTFIAKFISASRFNSIFSSDVGGNFETICQVLLEKLKELQFDRNAMNGYRKQNHPMCQLEILKHSGMNVELFKAMSKDHPHKRDQFDSYVILAGILIVFYANRTQWQKKYVSESQFLDAYKDKLYFTNDSVKDLMGFANVLNNLLEYVAPKAMKSKLMLMASCVVGGPHHKIFVTGSFQTDQTSNRVIIYHTETNTTIHIRPKRRVDGKYHSDADGGYDEYDVADDDEHEEDSVGVSVDCDESTTTTTTTVSSAKGETKEEYVASMNDIVQYEQPRRRAKLDHRVVAMPSGIAPLHNYE